MTAEDPLADICDVCGQKVTSEVHFDLVWDSSAVHPQAPEQDGKRLLTVCSAEHLAALREEYRQRPFQEEELWAGQIDRALRGVRGGLSRERLAQLTGLQPHEIERALEWNNQRLQQLREASDDEGEDEENNGE